MLVEGTVTQIQNRKTPYGVLHSIIVDGEMYGTGNVAPSVREGQRVKFEAETNAKGYKQLAKKSTIEVVQVAEPPPLPTATTTRNETKGNYLPDREKQVTISRQAARNAAIAFLNVCAISDSLPIPKGSKEKFTGMLALCEQLTEDFLKYSLEGSVASAAHPAVDAAKADTEGWAESN